MKPVHFCTWPLGDMSGGLSQHVHFTLFGWQVSNKGYIGCWAVGSNVLSGFQRFAWVERPVETILPNYWCPHPFASSKKGMFSSKKGIFFHPSFEETSCWCAVIGPWTFSSLAMCMFVFFHQIKKQIYIVPECFQCNMLKWILLVLKIESFNTDFESVSRSI